MFCFTLYGYMLRKVQFGADFQQILFQVLTMNRVFQRLMLFVEIKHDIGHIDRYCLSVKHDNVVNRKTGLKFTHMSAYAVFK